MCRRTGRWRSGSDGGRIKKWNRLILESLCRSSWWGWLCWACVWPLPRPLENKIDPLIKRFDEQKGIIDSYVQRERDWKKNKILLGKEIAALEKKLNKKGNHE